MPGFCLICIISHWCMRWLGCCMLSTHASAGARFNAKINTEWQVLMIRDIGEDQGYVI